MSQNKTKQIIEAEELLERAFAAEQISKKCEFARKVIDRSQDYPDAYNILAELEAPTHEEAKDLYEMGVKAGKRILKKELEEDVGLFWGIYETRPFMRSLFGLGISERQLGNLKIAIETFQEIIKLNTSDNQGARYSLLHWLIEDQNFKAARKLVAKYPDDASVFWKYGLALLEFADKGNSTQSQELIREAIKQNNAVPDYIIEKYEIPDLTHVYHYRLGSIEEAAIYARNALPTWHKVKEAKNWLMENFLSKSEMKDFAIKTSFLSLIHTMSEDTLFDLNSAIIIRLDEIEEERIKNTISRFKIGDEISFFNKDTLFKEAKGVIVKINKKSVEVKCKKDNKQHRIHARYLESQEGKNIH